VSQAIAIAIAAAVAAAVVAAVLPLSAMAQEIEFAVIDIEGLEALQQEFGAFEEITGLEVTLFPVNSRTAAVEALTAEHVHFVLTGPAPSDLRS
jgi:phosphonate transport system substrate-binding protein